MQDLRALLCGTAMLAPLAPVQEQAIENAHEAQTQAGLFAIEEGNCLACHRASPAVTDRIHSVQAPYLKDVGARVTPDYLRGFLADPHGTKPGTAMPDLLAAGTPEQKSAVVEPLVHFLVSRGGPMPAAAAAVFPSAMEEGRQLFHEVGCVQCHEPIEPAGNLEYSLEALEKDPSLEEADDLAADALHGMPARHRIPFPDLAAKTSIDALAKFLEDPLAVRPSGRMPSLRLTQSEAHDIAAYLLTRGETDQSSAFPGLQFAYYEEAFQEEAPDFDAYVPVRIGASDRIVLPDHRPDAFGVRFTAALRIDIAGEYRFFTSSDDGSRLWIDDELVVSNTGPHGMQEEQGSIVLEPGTHSITVTMFEIGGDEALEVHWQAPGEEKTEIPAERFSYRAASLEPRGVRDFVLNEALVATGERLFLALGCASCHDVGLEELDTSSPLVAPSFEDLAEKGGGCLDPTAKPRRPQFGEAIDSASVMALIDQQDALVRYQAPAEALTETLARLRCFACHSRKGVGGPSEARLPYFYVLGDHDLGDEGRIPPILDETGSKLRFEWLRRVLEDGASARSYLATRMPRFGADNLQGLAELFRQVDQRPDDTKAPPFSMESVENGRRVVGTRGLGCINCHEFAGHDSLGIPAVDLAELTERLNPEWFHRLLKDPISLNMNTRMPEFWVGGKSPVENVLGGDPDAQIDAMWNYFKLGSAMPLPDGLVVPDAEYELTPIDEPILCGVFMQDVSPRTLLVGFPMHTHYAFDLESSRLAKIWRGRFFNARGTWEGRAGQLEKPPSKDVFELPPGPAFARFSGDETDWPEDAPAPRALGRRFDAERRPIFRYALGDIVIEEQPIPEITPGGTRVLRRFLVQSSDPIDDLWFQGATGVRRVKLQWVAGEAHSASFEEIVEW